MYFLFAKIRELLDMIVQKLLSLLSAACFSFYNSCLVTVILIVFALNITFLQFSLN